MTYKPSWNIKLWNLQIKNQFNFHYRKKSTFFFDYVLKYNNLLNLRKATILAATNNKNDKYFFMGLFMSFNAFSSFYALQKIAEWLWKMDDFHSDISNNALRAGAIVIKLCVVGKYGILDKVKNFHFTIDLAI